MEVSVLSKKVYKELQEIKLPKEIKNQEAKVYLIPNKDKWNSNQKLLKRLNDNKGFDFGNKLLTVNALIDNKDIINIEELILPEKLAVYNKEIIGFIMPYIKSINFQWLLKSNEFDNATKKRLLIEIGEILDKMNNRRKNIKLKDFYLNDIREANFIYNIETKHLNVVDLDSCSISKNNPMLALYLTSFSEIINYPFKYEVNRNSSDLSYEYYIKPSNNTEYYCYNMILLNYLFQDKAYNMNTKDFFLYINYLDSIGFPKCLLDALSYMYTSVDNQNIKPYLEDLPTDDKILTLANKTNFYIKCKNKCL